MTRAFVAARPPPPVPDAIEARVAPVAMAAGRPVSRDQSQGAEWIRELAAQVERRLAPLGHGRD